MMDSETTTFNELCEQGAQISNEVGEAAVEMGQQASKEVARFLCLAFAELKNVDAESIGEDVLEALEEMKETGIPIAQELMKDVGVKLGVASKYLSDVDAQNLYDEVGKAASAYLEGFLKFREQLSEWMDVAIDEGRVLVKTAMPALAVGAAAVVGLMEDVGEGPSMLSRTWMLWEIFTTLLILRKSLVIHSMI